MAPKSPKSEVEKIMGKLTDALRQEFASTQQIERSEDGKIRIPDYMTAADASDALRKYHDSMEEPTREKFEMTGHVDDCLHAVIKALENSFGQALAKSESFSFFGFEFLIPAQVKTITTAYGKTMNVPLGHVEIPGLPVTMDIDTQPNVKDVSASKVTVIFDFKKMYQTLVDRIKKEARRILREESIFLHQAINSDFTFINLESFDVSRIVYSRQEERDLNSLLFNYVSDYDYFTKQRKLPTKRIILLTGRYGTGKTLTALKTAHVCDRAGWTFINVLPGHDIVQAIQIAKRYQPACLFFEDIDAETDTDKRTDRMNAILNTLDGTLTKDAKIVVVLTTNHLERVNRAMIRPGRIDAFVEMGLMDEQSIIGLTRVYISPETAAKCNPVDLLKVSAEFTPAFVVEALGRAQLYARGDGRDAIEQDDIILALNGIRAQFNEMMSTQQVDKSSLQADFESLVSEKTSQVVKAHFDEFEQKLDARVFAQK